MAATGFFDRDGKIAFKAEPKLAGRFRTTVVVRR